MLQSLKRRLMPVTLSRAIHIAHRLAARGDYAKKKNWYRYPVENLMEYIGATRVENPRLWPREELVREGDILIEDVTPEMIDGWFAWLRDYEPHTGGGRRLSAHTRDSYGRMLRAFFNKLVEAGHLDRAPTRRLVLPKPPRKGKKDISQGDLEAMVRHSKRNWRDHAIVLILRDSGCRVGELCSMRISTTHIERGEDGQLIGSAEVIGKGYKIREIIFGDGACRALRNYMDFRPVGSGDEMWLSQSGARPFTGDGVYQMLRRIAAEAGVERFNPHAFRHAFAKYHIEAGTPMKLIQEWLGHEELSTTYDQYVQYDTGELKRLFAKYGRRDGDRRP